MRADIYDRIWAKAKDPAYVRFLEVTFPQFMSFTPGGTNYLPTRFTIDERVDRWFKACEHLRDEAMYLNIRLDGFPRVPDKYSTPERMAVKFATSSKLRNLRNAWKDNMKSLGIDYGDHLWRMPRSHEQEWSDEWKYFINMVTSVYGETLPEVVIA